MDSSGASKTAPATGPPEPSVSETAPATGPLDSSLSEIGLSNLRLKDRIFYAVFNCYLADRKLMQPGLFWQQEVL